MNKTGDGNNMTRDNE